MNVLVTGGTGHLGRLTCGELKLRGHSERIFDLADNTTSDVCDPAAVEEAVNTADAVIHLAGLIGTAELWAAPARAVEVNIGGSVNVLEACARYGVRYVSVQTGTPWLSTYAITKRTASAFALAYALWRDVHATVLAPFNAYGPPAPNGSLGLGSKIIPSFVSAALEGRPIPVIGDGSQVVDLVWAQTVAEALAAAVDHGPGDGRIIDVGSGRGRTVTELAQLVLELTGSMAGVEYCPTRIGEGPEHPVADTREMRNVLGVVATDADDGVLRTRLRQVIEAWRLTRNRR